jgi:hypothetical protein
MGVVPSLIGRKSDGGVEGSRLAASPSERAFGANPMIYLPYLYEIKFFAKLSEAATAKGAGAKRTGDGRVRRGVT